MVKIASGAKVPSGPGAGGCGEASLKGQGAGVQNPRGLRGKRFRPLLRGPEVLDPVVLAPAVRVGVPSSGGERVRVSF